MLRPTIFGRLSLLCLASTLLASGGCIRPLPQTSYQIKGQFIDPLFPHLKGKKVAVVCHDENGLSDGADSVMLARYVQAKLSENVKNIKLISPENVDKWLNENGSREADCKVLGKSVKADFVLAIKLANMSLRDESHSVYKGKADITVTVYEIGKGGTIAFRKSFPEFEFPKMDGPSIVDTTEGKFRVSFLTIVSQHIGVLFYPYDPKELAVQDPISMRL